MAEHTDRFRIVLLANKPESWRQRVAQWLHNLADRIDGRLSTAVQVTSDPPVPEAVVRRALNMGLGYRYELLRAEAREECIERLLRRSAPSLYGDRRG